MHGPIREHAETPRSPFSLRGRIVESRKTSIAVEDRLRVVPFEEFCEIAQVGHSRGYEFGRRQIGFGRTAPAGSYSQLVRLSRAATRGTADFHARPTSGQPAVTTI